MDSYPQRKPIRLRTFDYSRNGAYFVTLCTHNRAPLFGRIADAVLCGHPHHPDKMIERWIVEIGRKFPRVRIGHYVIMPNHVHMIVLLGEEPAGGHTGPPLLSIIEWFKTMTTNEYIRGVKAHLYAPYARHLWQRSFHDHIIRNEADYLRIWQYIDENPRKWHEDRYFNE